LKKEGEEDDEFDGEGFSSIKKKTPVFQKKTPVFQKKKHFLQTIQNRTWSADGDQ
jgi:hypothetical protein